MLTKAKATSDMIEEKLMNVGVMQLPGSPQPRIVKLAITLPVMLGKAPSNKSLTKFSGPNVNPVNWLPAGVLSPALVLNVSVVNVPLSPVVF